MKTSQELQKLIIERLGFIPPFFGPALSEPMILSSLWGQTKDCYIENPLPNLFKEKIAALLARYCPVPYCLFCHTSTLKPLGMTAEAVLSLLTTPSPTQQELKMKISAEYNGPLITAPEPGSELEDLVLSCVVAWYLDVETELSRRKLRSILQESSYNYLILFLAYNKTALTWAEAHPEISYLDDKRVQDHLGDLIVKEPGLKTFLENYRSLVTTPQGQLLEKFNAEKVSLEILLHQKSQEIDEQRAVAMNHSKMSLLGEMAGTMAHEIKNPLAIIIGMVAVIEKSDPQKVKEHLGVIKSTAQRIDGIVDSLKFYSRNSALDKMGSYSINKIIEQTLALSQQKLYAANCELRVNLLREDFLLHCLPVAISQALLNLINNSCDAIEESKEKWIEIECSLDPSGLVILVRDSGPSIPKEVREKIMNPFFTTKSVGKGTGLGLTIVKKVVEQHNGKIELETGSETTSFKLYFPNTADVS